jgi:CRISPR-associated protein Cmr5
MANGKRRGGDRERGRQGHQSSAQSPGNSQLQQAPRAGQSNEPTVTASPAVIGGQTLQQERARYALREVNAAIGEGVEEKTKKEFKSNAAKLPAMIQMNGLGQAAAFYFSQGGTHEKLYSLLSNWLKQPGQPYAGTQNLLDGITQQNMHDYQIAQSEALLLLDWVKRFAKALVRED